MRMHTPAGSDGLVPGLGIGDVRIDSRLVSAVFFFPRDGHARQQAAEYRFQGLRLRVLVLDTCMHTQAPACPHV